MRDPALKVPPITLTEPKATTKQLKNFSTKKWTNQQNDPQTFTEERTSNNASRLMFHG